MRWVVMILLAIPATSVAAWGDVLWFEDNFEGADLDTTVWEVGAHGASGISVDGGWLYIEADQDGNMPRVLLRTDVVPFPPGDFKIEFRSEYLVVHDWGCGGVVNHEDTPEGNWWGCWQGTTVRLRMQLLGQVVWQTPEVDVDPHVFACVREGQTLTAYVDGEQAGSSTTELLPQLLYFGHRPYESGSWTTFRVDYVRIWDLGPTAAKDSTWSSIKALYR